MHEPETVGTKAGLTLRGLAILAAFATLAPAQARLAPPPGTRIVYVRADLTTGAENGTSWANAFRGRGGLSNAIASSAPEDQIWVAKGTYTPQPPGGSRTISFSSTSTLTICGGFAGTETAFNQRDIAANPTILSGDLNGDDTPGFGNRSDNTLHVFHSRAGAPPLSLDGVTISGGDATVNGDTDGGGILLKGGTKVTLRNVTFTDNRSRYGACVMGFSGNSVIADSCTFVNNWANATGGAMWFAAATATITNCRFERNRGVDYGGAIRFSGSGVTCVGSVFLNNTSGRGAALDIWDSNPSFVNCTFANNVSDGTWSPLGSIFLNNAACQSSFRNCVFRELNAFVSPGGVCEPNATYCCFWIFQPGVGNVGGDPMFVDLERGDLRLLPGSVCIDAGRNDLVPASLLLDNARNPRFFDDPTVPDTGVGSAPIVDMGAYELQAHPCPSDVNFDGFVNGSDFDEFVANFVLGRDRADFDRNGFVSADDFDAFVRAFEAGC